MKHLPIVLPGVHHGFHPEASGADAEADLEALRATFRTIDKTMNNSH